MPVCTHCGAPSGPLWTEYSTSTNIRLTVCDQSHCKRWADPYVEQPPLVLALDLLLLKRAVYRSLLFNRGVAPLKAGGGQAARKQQSRPKVIRTLLVRLSLITVLVDAYLRFSSAAAQGHQFGPFAPLAVCALEFIAFQLGVTLACWLLLKSRNVLCARSRLAGRLLLRGREAEVREAGKEFRYELVPLTVVLSSLPKTLLLLLLSLFGTSTASRPAAVPPDLAFLPAFAQHALAPLIPLLGEVDRPWVVRHVLGGLSAGFALQVLLAPLAVGAVASTTCLVAAYAARTGVAAWAERKRWV